MARTLTGLVSSDKGDKTIVVAIRTRKTHPIYKKQYTETTKFMAHDEENTAKEGDRVIIAETRPISARKRFTLVSIVEKAHVKHVEADPLLEVTQEAPAEKPVVKPKAKTAAAKPAEKETK